MSKPIPLQYGKYYHIYNRGNNRENIFIEERNYRYFLQLYAKHVTPIADTYAYCLLRNHFHFLVRIKDHSDLTGLEEPVRSKPPLFQRPFGRIEVDSDAYFAWLVVYIHQNPQKHGFVDDFRTWPYSSYRPLLSTKPTRLQRDGVLTWFDGVDNFVASHQQEVSEQKVAVWVPEDFD